MNHLKTIIFALFGDNSRRGPAPAWLLNLLLAVLFVALPAVLLISGSGVITAAITGVALLFLAAVSIFISRNTMEYRRRFSQEMYKHWSYRIGAPAISLSTYDKDTVKETARTLRDHLRITWIGRQPMRIALQGAAGDPSYKDLLEFENYSSEKGLRGHRTAGGEAYIFDLDALPRGEMHLWVVSRDSQEYRHHQALKLAVEMLDSSNIVGTISGTLPTISVQCSPKGQLRHIEVDDSLPSEYQVRNLMETLNRVVPPSKDKMWVQDEGGLGSKLSVSMVSRKSGKGASVQAIALLNNLLDKAKQQGRYISMNGEVSSLEVDSTGPITFTVQFTQIGDLHDQDKLKDYLKRFALEMRNEAIPGKWRVKNSLARNSSITFTRQ